jgi:(3S)-malyl-CoA thioesterase
MTPSEYAPRSLLYVPGSNARALEKAAGLAADMLIIDLEDAVPADRKAEARAAMRAAVTAGFTGKRVAVRVNATGTAEQADDIAALDGLKARCRGASQSRCAVRSRATARPWPCRSSR